MYMNPTFPAGGVSWLIQACAQAMALASMHIGSGPGVAGLSGMQVKPFVPLRTVRMVPSASMATTVAPFATLGGAAFIALAMSSASLGAFLAGDALIAAMGERIRKPMKTNFAYIVIV